MKFIKKKIDNLIIDIKNNLNIYTTNKFFYKFKKNSKYEIINIKKTNTIQNIEVPILLKRKKLILNNLHLIKKELVLYNKNKNIKILGIYSNNFSFHFKKTFSIIELLYILIFIKNNKLVVLNTCCNGNGITVSEENGIWI